MWWALLPLELLRKIRFPCIAILLYSAPEEGTPMAQTKQQKVSGKAVLAAPQTQKEAKQQISSLLRKNAEAMKALA